MKGKMEGVIVKFPGEIEEYMSIGNKDTEFKEHIITVSLGQSIQAVLDEIPEENTEKICIRLEPGIYHERISLTKPYITLEGEGSTPESTMITGSLGAYEILEDGIKRGTFRTQTFFVHTHDIILKNLTIENTAGPGKKAGQAIALYADGDRLVFENLRLIGNQDTLFTGPLPEKEVEPGGFRGPLEFAPRINGRQYYKNCYIEGNIDFIFGSATAYFENCEIFCRDPEPERNAAEEKRTVAYITAASTPEGQAYGYIFNHCRLTGDAPEGSCYLGRPWREYARTIYLNCEMGAHIAPEGWDDWNKPAAHQTVFYAEYQSTGPGACPARRPAWVHCLSAPIEPQEILWKSEADTDRLP